MAGVEKTDLMKLPIEKTSSTITNGNLLFKLHNQNFDFFFSSFFYLKECETNYKQPMVVIEQKQEISSVEQRIVRSPKERKIKSI